MKKFLFAAIAIVGFSISSYAQTTPAKKVVPPVVTVSAKPAATAAPIKSDGTPDMRYKANKEADKVAPKLKKDGTPDLRYNRNKKQ